MYQTIEEKLSAIKAINDEKSRVELALSMLYQAGTLRSASLSWSDSGVNSLPIPDDVRPQIVKLMRTSYERRQLELIDKATELMR